MIPYHYAICTSYKEYPSTFQFFSVKRVHNEITSSFVELLHFFARNEYFFNKLRFPDPNLKALGVFELTL